MLRIVIAQQAERDLRRLPADIFQRVVPEIKALAQTPRPPGCRKLTGSKSDYRIRVGDYRVLYEIGDKVLLLMSSFAR